VQRLPPWDEDPEARSLASASVSPLAFQVKAEEPSACVSPLVFQVKAEDPPDVPGMSSLPVLVS
jgi:hypothetical protein